MRNYLNFRAQKLRKMSLLMLSNHLNFRAKTTKKAIFFTLDNNLNFRAQTPKIEKYVDITQLFEFSRPKLRKLRNMLILRNKLNFCAQTMINILILRFLDNFNKVCTINVQKALNYAIILQSPSKSTTFGFVGPLLLSYERSKIRRLLALKKDIIRPENQD